MTDAEAVEIMLVDRITWVKNSVFAHTEHGAVWLGYVIRHPKFSGAPERFEAIWVHKGVAWETAYCATRAAALRWLLERWAGSDKRRGLMGLEALV